MNDANGQGALDGVHVEGAHAGSRGSWSSKFAEEVLYKYCWAFFLLGSVDLLGQGH